MHLNCIWEIVISKSELEPLLTEVLAFTCLVELFHVLYPKRLQRISPSGRSDFGVFLCRGHRRCILFCDLIKKCKVLGEAFGSLIRFATVG